MSLKSESDQSFESRLAAYSQSAGEAVKKSGNLAASSGYFAGAAAVLSLGSTEAEGALVLGDLNVVLDPTSGNSLSVDIDIPDFGHPSRDFVFQAHLDEAGIGDRDWFRMGGENGNLVAGRIYSAGFNYVSRLSLGDTLSAALNFIDGDSTSDSYLASSQHPSYPASGEWLGGNTGFVGFELNDPSGTLYGWLEVRVDADNGGGEIIGYGLETDPAADNVTITNVPEANSIACLALGAAGLLGWRQRRTVGA
jgi:hypothetical protein